MDSTKFKAAICQIRTELDQRETMEKAGRMVREAAENGANVVCLPEMFNCPYSRDYFRRYAHLGHEDAVREMSGWARENGMVHLFDVDIPGMRFHESHTFTPGEDITVFDTRYGRFGVAICFDVRFPELFRAMAKRGAKMIFLPAQFNMKTGPAHWDLSLRMRAVDNEVFFAGAAAARYEGFAYECWGHSAFIDPYGVVLSKCDEKERILYTEIDLSRVETVREQLPTFNRLREDVYPVAK